MWSVPIHVITMVMIVHHTVMGAHDDTCIHRDTVCHIPLWIVFQITDDAEHEYLGPDTHNADRKYTFCTNTDTQPRELPCQMLVCDQNYIRTGGSAS